MAAAAPLSFAAAAPKEEEHTKKAPMRTVQLEGQVVLKIAKHCRESDAAAMVTGQLLGLDVGPTLEVTDCFPYPVRRRRCRRLLRRAPALRGVCLAGRLHAWLPSIAQSGHTARLHAALHAAPSARHPPAHCSPRLLPLLLLPHLPCPFPAPACRAARRTTRLWVRARATSWR
jgi:hypothetical protein